MNSHGEGCECSKCNKNAADASQENVTLRKFVVMVRNIKPLFEQVPVIQRTHRGKVLKPTRVRSAQSKNFKRTVGAGTDVAMGHPRRIRKPEEPDKKLVVNTPPNSASKKYSTNCWTAGPPVAPRGGHATDKVQAKNQSK